MATLVFEDPVLTDEPKDICVSCVDAETDGGHITVPVTTPKFQSMLNPKHYLSEKAWACLGDPYVNIVTKIHLLAAVMLALKIEKPSEKSVRGTSLS